MAEDKDLFDIVPGDDGVDEIYEAIPDDAVEHAEAATEAQTKADDAVAAGDYESAAEFRAEAEAEAGLAADDSMLHGSSSLQLEVADEQQDKAEALQEESAAHAREGDYEAARQDAQDAATYHSWADQNAGGSDHSGLAEKEHQQLDWAVWEQDIANENMEAAEAYAASGDMETAENYADSAADHQATADDYGDAGEHGGDLAVTDPASEVADDGTTE
jgi:hypothetical protein